MFASVAQKSTGDPIPNNKRFWFINNGYGDQSSQRSSSGQWERAAVSGLVRVLYNYENKYCLNASFCRDGSSQISPENRWQSFYSVGAVWEMSRETFMASISQVNFLKLKGSWGVLGVQNTDECTGGEGRFDEAEISGLVFTQRRKGATAQRILNSFQYLLLTSLFLCSSVHYSFASSAPPRLCVKYYANYKMANYHI